MRESGGAVPLLHSWVEEKNHSTFHRAIWQYLPNFKHIYLKETIWRRLDNLTILNLLSCDCNISFHLFICFCLLFITQFSSVQSSSVAQFCLTLCDPMNHSTPGFPVHHQLMEFTQTHVRGFSDTIQPFILCRPLLLLPQIPPSITVFFNESTLHLK